MPDDKGDARSLGHRPALDGLRGVAILLVVAGHFGVWTLDGAGGPGVTLFFVLSGFLITVLLLEEFDGTGGIDFRRFYARRALRLLPALGLLLVVVTALSAIRGTLSDDGAGLLSVVFYVANWYRVATGGILDLVGHTWSLAVEEQFYITWPGILLISVALIRDRRRLITVLLGVAVLVALWRASLWFSGASINRVSVATDTRADALLIGAAMAVAFRVGKLPKPGLLPVVIAAAAIWCFSAFPDALVRSFGWEAGLELTLGIIVVEAAAAVLIARAMAGPWPGVEHPVLRWFGRVSYALYLWHFPIVTVIGTSTMLAFVVALSLSLLAAAVSWRFVEQPALRLKDRRAAAPRVPVLALHPPST